MKIIAKKQFDEIGDEYMKESNVEVDIRADEKDICIEFEKQLLIIPIEVFKGILNK
jgi:hypothetical protein